MAWGVQLVARPARHLWGSSVIRNAASLYASTVITGVLGFAFWLVAARTLSPESVGTGSALISAVSLAAYVCLFGLGTLSISQLAAADAPAGKIISTNTLVAGGLSAVGGVLLAVGLTVIPNNLDHSLRSVTQFVVFVVLAAATSALLVLDDASIGINRGTIQLRRNMLFAVGKLAVLPALAVPLGGAVGEPILNSWLAGSVLSLVVAVVLLKRAVPDGGSWRPALAWLREHHRQAWSHHFLNIAVLAPSLMGPLVVAVVLGPEANAGFSTAVLVVGILGVIPSQLSTALFALKPGDDEALRRECRSSMRICAVVAVASAVFFAIFSRWVLRVFHPSYESAWPAMVALALTIFPNAICAHYVAISRVRHRMARAAVRTTLFAVLQVVMLYLGARWDGMRGAAFAIAAAGVIEAVFFGPTVLAVVRGAAGTRPPSAA